jgi:tRNA U34 5-methylaminomethyl-2-thiouridine-forming methyltransferase MnmC
MEIPTLHFHTTADGSPTLSLGEQGEWMHHRHGAFAETLYVYGEAVNRVLPSPQPSFVSVGLGLGYVEMLLAARAVQSHTEETFCVRSFEADPVLRKNFQSGLQGHAPADFAAAYSSIANRFAKAFEIPPERIFDCLRMWGQSGRWVLEDALHPETLWARRYEAILYDAYSSDTHAPLWTAAFLSSLLSAAAAPRCVFATYAATGELKRTLARHQFRQESRPGFSGKRECTLATRP